MREVEAQIDGRWQRCALLCTAGYGSYRVVLPGGVIAEVRKIRALPGDE